MFYVSCKCGSRDVHHYRYKANSNTLNQFCGSCKINMTQLAVAKARKTRSKTLKTAPKRGKSLNIGLALVLWAFGAMCTLGATAYAEMSTEIVYVAEIATSTPVEIVEKKPETIVNKLETKAEIREYVLSEAKKAGVHVAKIDHIVENESHYNPEAVGDKDVPCTNKKSPLYGKGAHARGLWQITKCWYPDITDEQAHDIEWSTKWALQIIAHSKNDCITQWTTCRKWYKI